MPANIAEGRNGVHRAAYVHTPGWHKLGYTIPADKVANGIGVYWGDIYQQAQLDYPLELVPAGGRLGDDWVEDDRGRKAIMRTDLTPPAIFGYVSDIYSLIRNSQVGEVLDELVQQHEAAYVAAGALGRGERVWAVLELRAVKGLQIHGDPSTYGGFLVATTRHDGNGSLQVFRSVVRTECQNMLDMGLLRGEATGKIVSIAHTGDPAAKLEKAREILGFVNRFVEEFRAVGNALADTPLPRDFVGSFLEDLIPVEPDAERPAARIAEREAIADLYRESPTLLGVPGTAYRLVQAVAEYADHYRPLRARAEGAFREQRFTSLLAGPVHDLKQDALDRIVEKLEIRVADLVPA